MAFKEINDLSCDVTISLGGSNRKTGKVNPTKIEGYYLGARTVADNKKKSGVSYIYAFQTPKGNVGVWGKTDLDNKMKSAPLGAMLRVTQNGMPNTPNGEMYVYKVEVDAANTIQVDAAAPSTSEEDSSDSYDASAYDDLEDTLEDEAPLGQGPENRHPTA